MQPPPVVFLEYLFLRAEREARSESTSIIWEKSEYERPAVVTLFGRLFLWNGMTNSRTVILIRCHHGWRMPYGRCGRCHTNFARATPTFCPFIIIGHTNFDLPVIHIMFWPHQLWKPSSAHGCHHPINHVFDRYRYPPVPATARGTCRGEGVGDTLSIGNSTTADPIAFKFGVCLETS